MQDGKIDNMENQNFDYSRTHTIDGTTSKSCTLVKKLEWHARTSKG